MAPLICTMDHPSVNVSNLKEKSIDLQRVNKIKKNLYLKKTMDSKCSLRKISILFYFFLKKRKGAQWLSGRMLDSRPRGRGFKPHRCHCVGKAHLS